MKLSKTSWLILTVGIFIVAFASLGTAYSQQSQKQKQMEEELSVAELRLDKFQIEQLSSRQEELEEQLNQAMSQLEMAKDNLQQSIKSIEVADSLFDIAGTCSVEITEITSPGRLTDELEGIICFVLPLTVRAEGDVLSLIRFIMTLNNDFTTGVVKSADISVSGNISEERSSANIQLLTYTYRGD